LALVGLLPFLAAADDTSALPTPTIPAPLSVRDQSLFEVGVFAGGGYVPDYPASNQGRFKFLGLPYLIYRGNVVRADREGTRARLFQSSFMNVELSAAASFATRSKDDDARQGMPDLDYLLEVGPRISMALSDLGGYGKMRLFVPLRVVCSSDLSNFHERGFTLTPALYARLDHLLLPDWIVVMQISGNFANRQLSAYFYDVAPEFVTPARSFYDARAGYLGTDWFTGVVIPVARHFRIFTGIQLWNFSGSANSASPLFKRETTLTSIFGVSYTFYESHRPAKKD